MDPALREDDPIRSYPGPPPEPNPLAERVRQGAMIHLMLAGHDSQSGEASPNGAEIDALAESLEWPVGVVRADPTGARQRLAMLRARTILADAPATTTWLAADPENAAAARQDLAPLSGIERGVAAAFPGPERQADQTPPNEPGDWGRGDLATRLNGLDAAVRATRATTFPMARPQRFTAFANTLAPRAAVYLPTGRLADAMAGSTAPPRSQAWERSGVSILWPSLDEGGPEARAAIPLPVYLAAVASTDAHEALIDHLSFQPDGPCAADPARTPPTTIDAPQPRERLWPAQPVQPDILGGWDRAGPDPLVAKLAPQRPPNPFHYVVDETGAVLKWEARPLDPQAGSRPFGPRTQLRLAPVSAREKQQYVEWLVGAKADYVAGLTSPEERSAALTAGAASAESRVHAQSNQIDWKFIGQREGEAIRAAYVPKAKGGVSGHSGVTVATGFDLGGRTAAGLRELGFDDTLIQELTPYLGLTGDVASSYVERHPLTLSVDQVSSIDKAVRAADLSTLTSKFDHDSRIGPFAELPSGAKTAIVSLFYQYGVQDPAKAAPVYWRQITNGDWQGAYRNLLNFGDEYDSRRKLEAELLHRDIIAGTLPMGKPNSAPLSISAIDRPSGKR